MYKQVISSEEERERNKANDEEEKRWNESNESEIISQGGISSDETLREKHRKASLLKRDALAEEQKIKKREKDRRVKQERRQRLKEMTKKPFNYLYFIPIYIDKYVYSNTTNVFTYSYFTTSGIATY